MVLEKMSSLWCRVKDTSQSLFCPIPALMQTELEELRRINDEQTLAQTQVGRFTACMYFV